MLSVSRNLQQKSAAEIGGYDCHAEGGQKGHVLL